MAKISALLRPCSDGPKKSFALFTVCFCTRYYYFLIRHTILFVIGCVVHIIPPQNYGDSLAHTRVQAFCWTEMIKNSFESPKVSKWIFP